jgi:hypothetical protein
VTFVVSLVGRDTVWLLADRRISWPGRRSDHGIKVMTLDTTDAGAILGYCGLGETSAGVQPSAWMHDVLQGWDMSMDDALWKLALEHQHHFPRHLGAAFKQHLVVAPAFVGESCRVYAVGTNMMGQVVHTRLRLADTRYPPHLPPAPPRVVYAGSGGKWFGADRESRNKLRTLWVRELCSLAKKHDQRRISAVVVADLLARLNLKVSREVSASVGPDCFVVWRSRPGSGLPSLGRQTTRATRA